MEIYALQFVLFLLLFVRVTTFLVTTPFFGHGNVPVQVKVALGMFIAFVLYPSLAVRAPQVDLRLVSLLLLVGREILAGLVLGFATTIVFEGVRAAGELVGFDLGYSISTVFDPDSGQNNPVVGEFFYLIFMLVFFLMNGHHHVIQSLLLSYETAPVGTMAISGPLVAKLVTLTGTVFAVAVKIAAPVIVSTFLINVAMSILARVAPQMNVFLISFPIKIGVGLLVLMASAPMAVYVFKKLLAGFENDVLELVNVM